MTDITYCMNTDSKDLSKWACAFTRIWRVGQYYYGVNEEGIHRFVGSTDDGVPIVCSVKTTPNDLDSEALKRIPYSRVEARGAADIELWLDGTSAGKIHMDSVSKRAKFARGVRGRFLTFEVTSSDPSFTLLEIAPTIESLHRGYQ